MSKRYSFIGLSTLSAVSSAVAAVLISGVPAPQPAVGQSASFTQQDIDSTKVAAVASPYGVGLIHSIQREILQWVITGRGRYPTGQLRW